VTHTLTGLGARLLLASADALAGELRRVCNFLIDITPRFYLPRLYFKETAGSGVHPHANASGTGIRNFGTLLQLTVCNIAHYTPNLILEGL
jgi:hypothetical protein